MKNLIKSLLVIVLISASVFAQSPLTGAREYTRTNQHRLFKEFVDFLSIPNLASDRENIHRNAAFIMEMMRRRGLEPQLLDADSDATPPAVFAEWKTP